MKTVVVITLEFEHEDDIDMNAIARRALDAGSVQDALIEQSLVPDAVTCVDATHRCRKHTP